MRDGVEKITNIALNGLWLFLPALVTAPSLALLVLVLSSVLPGDPVSIVLVFLAVLQTLVIASYQRQQKGMKTILGILLLGWVIQVLSIAVVWSIAGVLQFDVLRFLFWIPLGIIGSQIVASLVYFLLQIVGQRLQPSFFHRRSFPLVGFLILMGCVLIVKSVLSTNGRNQSQVARDRKDTNYDISEIAFRAGEKTTQLGRLPRPLRVFHTSAGYVGVSLSGEKAPLAFLDSMGAGKIDHLFLDVFSDKVYFLRDGIGYAYDLAAKTTVALPAPVQAALQEQVPDIVGTLHKRRIIAAHASYIALADTELAGTGDVVVYDVHSGEKVFQTAYLGYDQNRVVLFWINGKGYRLFLNGQGKPSQYPVIKPGGLYQRTESTADVTMAIYLDENSESYHRLSDDEMMKGVGKVVFSSGNEWFFDDKTPILELQTAYPHERYGESKFSIRNIYLLEDGRLAVEIEKSLIVINLTDKHAETILDQNSIKQLLETAKLLSADDENAHYNISQCGYDAYTEAFSKEKDSVFEFCLK